MSKIDSQMYRNISIHAPREGCDLNRFNANSISKYFNPRTP